MKSNCFILNCTGLPIFNQLQLEEAIFRNSNDNWFIFSLGTLDAIVMGAFANIDQVIDLDRYTKTPVPIIKRFTGGGTVVVDENTLFQSFIFNKDSIENTAYPQQIMLWHAEFLKKCYANIDLNLTETDLTIGNLKVGGNAQSISRHRWVHHTSFLWDFDPSKMKLLKYPPKTPTYRQKRSHEEFLTTLKQAFQNKESWILPVIEQLNTKFNLLQPSENVIQNLLKTPHRKINQLIDL